MENWYDLFPTHRLVKDDFLDILDKFRISKDSKAVLRYWRYLKEEGTMYNILYAMDKEDHWKTEVLIYSMSGFLTGSDYIEFKSLLGIHGHILEFLFAVDASPPNIDVIKYFVQVAKSPRYQSPEIAEWFYSNVCQVLPDYLVEDFSTNCNNAIYRWLNNKKNIKRIKKKRDPDVLDTIINLVVPTGVYS